MRAFFRRLFCRHSTIRIRRWHRDVVRPDMRSKLLYVDRFNVHCFAQCCDCDAFLHGQQHERLYDTKEEA